MKKVFSILVILAASTFVASTALAQGAAKNGPDQSLIRDSDLEKDSLHNLEVARHYFKLKKAYVAAIKRCEEIDAGNPNFAKMDEVLFIAGQSSMRLAESKGKQKSSKTPDELRNDARMYLGRLVAGYPQSQFFKQAEDDLKVLGPATESPKE
jgi:outer membrane protein assembly factor BamD (BamD/ComL family)